MTPLERLVTQALRLPIDIVQHIIRLNRDAAERAASTIFQKYTRGSRPRLAFRNMQGIMGDVNLSVPNRARWWRENWHPFYDSAIPLGPGNVPFPTAEARRQFVAGYRRRVRASLQ
jgi:plasmid stabilization system protein ParE